MFNGIVEYFYYLASGINDKIERMENSRFISIKLEEKKTIFSIIENVWHS